MRGRAVLAAVAVAAAAVPAVAARPLDESVAFTGLVRVEWFDGEGRHVSHLRVVADGGTMVVDGPRSLAARGDARFVYSQDDGAWAMVWPAGLGSAGRPSPEAKYDVDERIGPEIAGRRTRVFVITRDDAVWERRYVDPESDLVLRREQYDEDGHLRRIVAFEKLHATPAEVDRPGRSADLTPRPAPDGGGPGALAAGYRLLGTYRRGDTTHRLYSDGVYDLSVFEQEGRLRTADLPSTRDRARVGRRTGWRVSWAGGEVLVFQAGDAVLTVVGEGPWADVVRAARSLPSAGSSGFLARVRRACGSLLDAFVR